VLVKDDVEAAPGVDPEALIGEARRNLRQIRPPVVIDGDGSYRRTVLRVRGHMFGGPDW